MTIEIPFNENIFKEQLQLAFELAYRETIEKLNIIVLLSGVGIMIFVPFLFFTTTNEVTLLFFVLLVYFFYNTVRQKLAYKKLEKACQIKIESEILGYKQANTSSTLTFNPEFIQWQDYRMDVRLQWELFVGIRLVNNTLFFDIGKNLPFIIISKDEINSDNFQLLINLLTYKNLI